MRSRYTAYAVGDGAHLFRRGTLARVRTTSSPTPGCAGWG